jgi:hypothetical protein
MAKSSGTSGFWDNLFRHAKKAGLNARNFLLIALAALAFTALGAGAPPLAVIVLFVLVYGFDPAHEALKAKWSRDAVQAELDDTRKELSSYSARRRRELKAAEPELPLQLPPPGRKGGKK